MRIHVVSMPGLSLSLPGGTPALVLGTANSAGVAGTYIRTDDTILVFDVTLPVTSAVGDASAVGTATTAARRDHRHGRESFATNAVLLGATAAAGAATTPMRSNDTIAAFDATAPVTQAFSDAAAVGVVNFAARRDHRHGMPTPPITTLRALQGTSTTTAAHDLDTVAVSGLNANDVLLISASVSQGGAAGNTFGLRFQVTDFELNEGVTLAQNDRYQGMALMAQVNDVGTTMVMHQELGSLGLNAAGTIRKFTRRTNPAPDSWTGAWTLRLRSGGQAAGGTIYFSWLVMRLVSA